MAPMCRALSFSVLALAVAHASVTVRWNTRPAMPAATIPSAAPAQNARVIAVHGTRVVLRLRDGSQREYGATPQEARMLEGLVGTDIEFRAH